jgi:2-phosphoglycerate kinase
MYFYVYIFVYIHIYTGKSTFGMSVALSQGILKCISTDSAREVMRSYDDNPVLHRSSYEGDYNDYRV